MLYSLILIFLYKIVFFFGAFHSGIQTNQTMPKIMKKGSINKIQGIRLKLNLLQSHKIFDQKYPFSFAIIGIACQIH